MSTLSVTRIENVQDFDFANTQFVSAFNAANAAYSVSNTAYASVNSNWTVTNTVYGVANAAFGTANSKLSSSGGTISGDLVVTGNATFSGITTYANTQTLLIGDNILTLNADLPASVAATENAGLEVNRGLSGNASIIWNETGDAWNIRVNNNTAVTVTEAGNMGIGTISPLNAAGYSSITANNSTGAIYSGQTNGVETFRIQSTATYTFLNTVTNIPLILYTNNSERMRITAGGNVGIGNNAPTFPLVVSGTMGEVRVQGNNYSKFSWRNNLSGTDVKAWQAYAETSSNTWVLGTINDAENSGTDALRIYRSGNSISYFTIPNGSVGIGTTSPGYKLTVANNNPSLTNWIGSVNETATGGFGAGFISYIAPTNFGYLYQSGAGNLYLTNANTGGSVYFTANGSTRMLIDTSGNVAIGATYSQNKLFVVSANSSSVADSQIRIANPTFQTRLGFSANQINNTVNFIAGGSLVNPDFTWINNDSNQEHMRLTAGGNLGIGTTSPSQKLQVYSASSDAVSLTTGGTGFAGYCVVNGNGRSGLTGGLKMFSYSAGTAEITNDSNMPLVFGTNAVERMRIDATGRVGIGASPAFKLDVSGNTRIGYQVTQGNPGTTDITTNAATLISGTGGNYLAFGQYGATGSYAQWIQSSYQNPTTATYNLVLNPLGGNVGIGTAPAVSLDVGGRTDAIRLPVGTTAQRPAGANGHIRFNSTTSFYEIYDGPSSSWQSLLSRYNITYMIVAGGGGGGSAGGGGGGGYIAGTTTIAPATSLAVTVGAGGNPATTNSAQGGDGGSSSLGSLGTAIGGGGGGSYSGSPTGRSGGSGGGAGWPGSVSGGSGTAGQGNAGGSNSNAATPYTTGGGGGAAAVGGNNTGTTSSGSGGAGIINSINGSSLYWAGGGGGGAQGGTSAAGNGGIGGGGGGANYAGGSAGTGGGSALNSGGNGVLSSTQSACVGGSGGTNTGGGGGGMGISVQTGGTGGSGIVIISYPGPQRGSGGTVTSSGGNTIHTFTTSGTFTA